MQKKQLAVVLSPDHISQIILYYIYFIKKIILLFNMSKKYVL